MTTPPPHWIDHHASGSAEIGRIAARKTLALLNGETLDEPFTVMPTSLVLRGTTERVS